MKKVKYRELEEHPGYRFGDDGSAWTCWKKMTRGPGTGSYFIKSNKWRRLSLVIRGSYPAVCLKPHNGRPQRTISVHLLILRAFISPRPKGYVACHIDGSRTNNKLSNLRWGTVQSNHDDMLIHGTRLFGKKNHNYGKKWGRWAARKVSNYSK